MSREYTDSTLTEEAARSSLRECKDCGATFVLTADEKGWFFVRGLALPLRCKSCRRLRRLSQDTDVERTR